jgi:hypothetical protein
MTPLSRWKSATRSLAGAVVVLLGAGLPGCGRGLPPKASPEEARQALRTALDAWQQGESLETLTKGRPAVYFNDPKAHDGRRLMSYEMEDGYDFFGQSVRVRVNAMLEGKDGTVSERELTYIIDTSPVVVIIPD